MTALPYYFITLAASAGICSTVFGGEAAPQRGTVATASGSRPGNSIIRLDRDGKPVVPRREDLPAVSDRVDSAERTRADGDAPPLPELQTAPGGGEMILLDERFRHDSVARRPHSSGPAHVDCTTGPAAAHEPVASTPHPVETRPEGLEDGAP